jgi:hypothetical protein
LFADADWEKTRIWRTARRRDPATGKRYPWLYQEQAMAGHWHSTGSTLISARSISSSAVISPAPARSTTAGTSTPSGSAGRKASRSPRWITHSAPSATRRRTRQICDGLTDQKIYRFAGKWLARLPQPFTRADEDADYLGIGKELTNLAAMAKAGYTASRRLAGAECISHDPAAGAAALAMLTSPVISTTCTRVPGMRFPDPRVQALLAACYALALRPAGFTSRDLRHLLAPQLGKDPGDMTGGQISYDLRRLRDCQIIERIPHSRSYQLTADGLSTALFFTRLTRRVIIPALAEIAGAGPPPGSPLRHADPCLQDSHRRPRQPGLTRHPATTRHQARLTSGTSRNTQPKLTQPVKFLRGKITYQAGQPLVRTQGSEMPKFRRLLLPEPKYPSLLAPSWELRCLFLASAVRCRLGVRICHLNCGDSAGPGTSRVYLEAASPQASALQRNRDRSESSWPDRHESPHTAPLTTIRWTLCRPVACRAGGPTLVGATSRRTGRPSPRSPVTCDDDGR